MREREAPEPAVFARDVFAREVVDRDVVARDDAARRGVDAVRFVADERVARLGVGLRGVMADPRSLTSLRRSSRADRETLRAVRDQRRQLLLIPAQLLSDQLQQSRFHFPEPFPLPLLQ